MQSRMSQVEAVMWTVEKDPALRSDFTNITLLDRVPDEDRLRAKVQRAVVDIPRLGQRVVSPPLRLAPPQWQTDPTLDLEYHLRRVSAPPPGRMRELLDLAALLSAAPLDRSRPLWEFTVVEGLEGGRAALLQRMHHTITDGVGGLKLSLSLVDLEADPPDPVLPADISDSGVQQPTDQRPSTFGIVTDALGSVVARDRELIGQGLGAFAGLVAHPTSVPRRAGETVRLAGSLRRQVLVTQAARSPLLGARSLGRRFEVFSVSLDGTHRAAKALGGSLNDCYVAGVAGALGRYHERLGLPVGELRMAMPVSTREHADAAANRFAPSRVMVPVGPDDPATRFAAVHERLAGIRDEPALAAAESLAELLAFLPTAVLVTATRSQVRTIDFATSNLRGSPVDLFVGGARILANYPMGPRAGCALNVTMLSYCGDLHMGLNIDPAAVTEPDVLLDCFDESFAELIAAGVAS
ncbi:MAG: wax ester/triacylglycerol synthase family O-acyltransferase [Acidimicrobiia bacterium]